MGQHELLQDPGSFPVLIVYVKGYVVPEAFAEDTVRFHRKLAIFITYTKPHDDSVGVLVYFAHLGDLVSLLEIGVLVNADSVYPKVVSEVHFLPKL